MKTRARFLVIPILRYGVNGRRKVTSRPYSYSVTSAPPSFAPRRTVVIDERALKQFIWTVTLYKARESGDSGGGKRSIELKDSRENLNFVGTVGSRTALYLWPSGW